MRPGSETASWHRSRPGAVRTVALWALGAFLSAATGALPASAQQGIADLLAQRLTPQVIQDVFPGAEELIPSSARPLALAVKIGGETAGYIFSTLEVINATGYSGKSFDLVAGVTLEGDITGATLLEHRETIVGRGVPLARLDDYVAGFGAASLRDFKVIEPDILKRATVTARIMKRATQQAAEMVFRGHVLGDLYQPVTEPSLNREGFVPYTWDELMAGGSVVRTIVTNEEILEMFREQAGRGAAPDAPMRGRDNPFLELYVALITPASIGSSIFGDRTYSYYLTQQPEGGLIIWVAGKGSFSWLGTSYLHEATGYLLDRIKLVQGDLEIRLTRDNFGRAASRNAWIPVRDLFESARFYLPADSGLDPLLPWHVEVMVPGTAADGTEVWVQYPVAYQLPARHMLLPPPEPLAAWVEAWLYKKVDIAILSAMLVTATLIFVFQDLIARRRRLYRALRIGFLGFTLGWLGFYAGGQLSIVNLAAYLQAPFTGTGITTFLLDPILFIVAAYVAVSLFLIGRGVFCGWLCPFGAMQELTNKAGQLLHIPQIKVSNTVQQRLWSVKYLVAIGVIGIYFASATLGDTASEIEPFKTAINVKFVREWPFVLYAAALLAAGLFVERLYCRFLCPLGGSLAVMGRLHMFDWLKRRPACGTECRICEADCPIGAIEPSGAINANECLQCLDCQVDYYDDHKCPPLIQRRRRREGRGRGVEELGQERGEQ